MIPMRGLIPPGATVEQIGAGTAPEAMFKVLYGPRESLRRHAQTNVIGIPTGASSCSYTIERQFRLGGATQAEQEALLAWWLADDVIDVLRFLDAGHVQTAPAALSRQVRRQAQRKHQVLPLIVEIRRPRTSAPGPGGSDARSYSHQWEVAGAYRHVTRGPHVRCRVCHGADPHCSRCNGSGLDPELTRPCLRRDVTTGELHLPARLPARMGRAVHQGSRRRATETQGTAPPSRGRTRLSLALSPLSPGQHQ